MSSPAPMQLPLPGFTLPEPIREDTDQGTRLLNVVKALHAEHQRQLALKGAWPIEVKAARFLQSIKASDDGCAHLEVVAFERRTYSNLAAACQAAEAMGLV